jgi:hypothetical protein
VILLELIFPLLLTAQVCYHYIVVIINGANIFMVSIPEEISLTIGSPREKYAWFSQTGRELLFNIADDPQEMHDLSKEHPERLSYWREKLIQELVDREEGFVQDRKLIVGRPQSPTLKHAGKGI